MPTVSEFKQRVEKEWGAGETAAAWKKHYRSMKEQFTGVTKALVDAADARPGMSVLDLASGTGEPSLSLARGVAPTGTVTATDLNKAMLDALTANARDEGIANIDTRVCDAQELPFSDASFDRVTSRFGVMFFAEVDRALSGIKRVLKDGGRAAFLVWGPPEPGSYFGALAMPFLRRVAVKPDPDGPGPMRFAEAGKLARLVEAAGFRGVTEQSLRVPAAYRGSPAEMLTMMVEIAAPFRGAVASLSEEDKQAAEREVAENLRPLYDGTFTRVTAPVVIVSASK